jgi:Protein of unknown function (DUF1353)
MRITISKSVLFMTLASLPFAASALAGFSGSLVFTPKGCEKTGHCSLTYDLKYRDPNGIEWQADAKDKTDGASIPKWAQPIIGKPFDKRFTKAAAIHDHYCDRHVRPWRQTHRVFYDALIDTGVSTAHAKIMYYGVYLGGPKWTTLIKGKPCGSDVCVNVAPQIVLRQREAAYDAAGFQGELAAAKKLIKAKPDISLEELEKLAQTQRPGDFFYAHGDTVLVDPGTVEGIQLQGFFTEKDPAFGADFKVMDK